MKNFRYKRVALTLLVIGIIIPTSVFAFQKTKIQVEDRNDFVVEPGKTEIVVNPGESAVKNIIITNRSNKVANFKLTAEDLVGSDDPNHPTTLLGDEKGPYSLKDFIKPEISSFSLGFGEQISIPVTVSIPLNAEPRGYYGAVIVSNEPDKITDENVADTKGQTHIVSRIGSIFLVKIKGEGKQEGSLQDFKVMGPKKSFYEKRPEGFEIGFKNTGNVHLVPYGTITIKNMLGRVVAVLPANAYFVLPDSTRYRDILWDQGFGLGRYTASLHLYKGYGTEYVDSQIAFWVLPWKILLATLLIIIVIVTIGYYLSTRFEFRRKK